MAYHGDGQNGDHKIFPRIELEREDGVCLRSISVLLTVACPVLQLVDQQTRSLHRGDMLVDSLFVIDVHRSLQEENPPCISRQMLQV